MREFCEWENWSHVTLGYSERIRSERENRYLRIVLRMREEERKSGIGSVKERRDRGVIYERGDVYDLGRWGRVDKE